MCPFYFKAAYERYNSLEMYKEEKTPDQKMSGMDFQFPSILPHLGLPRLFPISPTEGRAGRDTQIGTKV